MPSGGRSVSATTVSERPSMSSPSASEGERRSPFKNRTPSVLRSCVGTARPVRASTTFTRRPTSSLTSAYGRTQPVGLCTATASPGSRSRAAPSSDSVSVPRSAPTSHRSARAAERAVTSLARASPLRAHDVKSSATDFGHVPVMASWCRPRYAARSALDVSIRSTSFAPFGHRAAREPAFRAAVDEATTARLSSRLWTNDPTHAFSLTGQLSAYGRNDPTCLGNSTGFEAVAAKYSAGVDHANLNAVLFPGPLGPARLPPPSRSPPRSPLPTRARSVSHAANVLSASLNLKSSPTNIMARPAPRASPSNDATASASSAAAAASQSTPVRSPVKSSARGTL